MKRYRARHDARIATGTGEHPHYGWTWLYTLTCSCRLVGKARPERAQAEADQREHLEAVPEITQPSLFDNDDLAA